MTDVVEFNNEAPQESEEHLNEMVGKDVMVRDGDDTFEVIENDEEDTGDNGDDVEVDAPELPEIDNHIPADFGELTTKLEENQAGFEAMRSAAMERGLAEEAITAMENEFAETGSLSPESFDALAKAGYPKDFVQSYLNANRGLAERAAESFYNQCGGVDNFKETVAFMAQTNPQSVKLLNDALARNDLNGALGIVGLAGSLRSANAQAQSQAEAQRYGQPAQRSLTQRATPAAYQPAPEGFASQREMIDAMSDKRYGRDATYTRSVEQKAANSTGW